MTVLPFMLFAKPLDKVAARSLSSTAIWEIALVDSVPVSKKPGDKGDKKKDNKQPEVKEVPKSRRQIKPSVVKPGVKVKPVRIPKPKVIKRTIGSLSRHLR